MPGQKWSAAEVKELTRLTPTGVGTAEIARTLTKKFKRNFSHASVRQKASVLALSIKAAPAAKAPPPKKLTRKHIDQEGTIAALRDKIAMYTKENKAFKKRVGELQEIRQVINATCQPMQPVPMQFEPQCGKSDHPYSAVAMVGDWHTAEVIEDVGDWGEYNLEIQEQRVKAYGQKVLRWLETQRAGLNIPILRVPVLGDMIAGDIHRELSVTNEVPAPEAACVAGRMLAELIAGWAPHAEYVLVDIVGADNHGRLTLKLQHKKGAANSFNMVVFWVAKALLREHENVEVVFHEDNPAELDFDGLTVLCTHGHTVRSWAGIPAYGMQRLAGRLAMGYLHHGRPFKAILCGHWHTPFSLPGGWLVNGCLCGTSEFDRAAGRFAAPSQSSYLWHPKYGAFNKTDWDLSDV